MSTRTKISKWKCAAAAAALAAALPASAQNVHWGIDGPSPTPGIYSSMFLNDANLAAVDAFLASQSVRVLKIDNASPVSAATIAYVYNKYKIDYTFADFEGPNAPARVAQLVDQIKASTATGAAFAANQAYVSNFAFAPVYKDTTGPTPVNAAAAYKAAGLNMASEELYPGSPSFRNPASNNSTAPNIRSALFTLPISRLSLASASLPAGHAHVAYVNRFNNWGNAALDTDGNPANGYQFLTQDQLPSRGDFQAQILHYRLRGATAVHGLDGGVQGYTPEQFRADIVHGWTGLPAVNQVLADPNAHTATLDTRIMTDGVYQTLEQAGVVFSGAYSAAQDKLVLLLSNLDEKSHALSFPASIGGKAIAGQYLVEPGAHEFLEFGGVGSTWNLLTETPVFVDTNRAGTGVPEPTTLALLTIATALTCTRRRRHF